MMSHLNRKLKSDSLIYSLKENIKLVKSYFSANYDISDYINMQLGYVLLFGDNVLECFRSINIDKVIISLTKKILDFIKKKGKCIVGFIRSIDTEMIKNCFIMIGEKLSEIGSNIGSMIEKAWKYVWNLVKGLFEK